MSYKCHLPRKLLLVELLFFSFPHFLLPQPLATGSSCVPRVGLAWHSRRGLSSDVQFFFSCFCLPGLRLQVATTKSSYSFLYLQLKYLDINSCIKIFKIGQCEILFLFSNSISKRCFETWLPWYMKHNHQMPLSSVSKLGLYSGWI